jgi:hypothetical protein
MREKYREYKDDKTKIVNTKESRLKIGFKTAI